MQEGFRLSGISEIRRCPGKRDQDGVSFANALCYNGALMIMVKGLLMVDHTLNIELSVIKLLKSLQVQEPILALHSHLQSTENKEES